MLKKSYPTLPRVASWRQIAKWKVPDSFYRGFSHSGCFCPEGFVTSEGFNFESPKGECRSDTFEEASINWNDDEHALRILCNQIAEKRKEIQFKFGYSEMKLGDVILQMRPYLKFFSHERKPLKNNPYHGNLLIEKSISPQTKKMMKDALAAVASLNYHPHPDFPDILKEGNNK